jgi:hypothetical protein
VTLGHSSKNITALIIYKVEDKGEITCPLRRLKHLQRASRDHELDSPSWVENQTVVYITDIACA